MHAGSSVKKGRFAQLYAASQIYQPSTKKAASRLRRRGRRLFQFLGRLPNVYRFHFFTSKAAVFSAFPPLFATLCPMQEA